MSTSATAADGMAAALSIEQKVELLTGADSWSLRGCPAIGLRPIVLSDGPAGVRGAQVSDDDPSSSLPCPVALGATWDEHLVRDLAGALGREARAKNVDGLLGPAVNIIRTPLAGRGFECFAEDPDLTARLAVAYVRGLQAAGVAAAAKHYVGNDSETGRRGYDSRIDEEVLRELYLVPFEACVRAGRVAMVMAAYNSVNGAPMTANAALIRDVLKREWGFDGVVVSDWNATRGTVATALAGLDLVMPGPGGPWGERLAAAVRNGEVPEDAIDDKLTRVLRLARRVGALAMTGDAGAGRAEPSSGGTPSPRHVDPALLRRAAARSFVLLRNAAPTASRGRPATGGRPAANVTGVAPLLPLDPAGLHSLAVIGPNAVYPQTQGGGSVNVLSFAGPTPAQALSAALGNAVVRVCEGCRTWTTVPAPLAGTVSDPLTGEHGVHLQVLAPDGSISFGGWRPRSVVTWWDRLPAPVNRPGSALVMRAVYRAAVTGTHLIGAAGLGTIRIDVDGVQRAEASMPAPGELIGAISRPPELRVPIALRAGAEIEVCVHNQPGCRAAVPFVVLRLGIAPVSDEDLMLAQAAEAAAAADAAVVVVGSAAGTESEGYDRDTLALPGRQNELVRRVAAANPNTVVVVNSGMPVLMPWIARVAAAVQVWLPGQAMGEALADILLGAAEPGGRLPVTIPRAEADCPVLHARPNGGELPYREGLLVGYRGYDRSGREPLFPFGHGLGYTSWEYQAASTAAQTLRAGEDARLTVTVRNSGRRAGGEIVQVYLEGPADDPSRPVRTLVAFARVVAEAGASARACLRVPARAFARYDPGQQRWIWPPGRYTLRVGRSAGDLRLRVPVNLTGGQGRR